MKLDQEIVNVIVKLSEALTFREDPVITEALTNLVTLILERAAVDAREAIEAYHKMAYEETNDNQS